MPTNQPNEYWKINIDIVKLKQKGFTDLGVNWFDKVINQFSKELIDDAITYGERDKKDGTGIEIAREHVRESAKKKRFDCPSSPPWTIWANILEYILMGAVGVGASNFSDDWGKIAVFGGIAISAISIVLRYQSKTYKNG